MKRTLRGRPCGACFAAALTMLASASTLAAPSDGGLSARDAAPPVDGGPNDPAWYTAQLADTFCRDRTACCGAPGVPLPQGISASDFARLCPLSITQQYLPDLGNAKRRYDPEAAAECLAKTRQAYRACTVTQEPAEFEACQFAFPGVVALGGECDTSIDCAGNRQLGNICFAGRCFAPPPHAREGEACAQTCTDDFQEHCTGTSPGLAWCYPENNLECSTSGTCVKSNALLGERCSPLACTSGTVCGSGSLCEMPAAVGEPCTDGYSCDENGYCDKPQGRCVPKKGNLESCTDNGQCIGESVCDGRCRYYWCSLPVDASLPGIPDSGTVGREASVSVPPRRDAGTPPVRTPRRDAGEPERDASTGTDIADTALDGKVEGNCTCDVARTTSPTHATGALLTALFALGLRRRRTSSVR